MLRLLLKLFRKKPVDCNELQTTKLSRVLTLLDLILLGVGSTLGAGAYVLSGEVAKTKAGPSIVLSFFIAAIVSVLAGLCYAEFGARVPKTGSAYVYSYITVGELIAFIIGWNLILEYAIGTASVARAWTANFDTLVDYKISNFLNSSMPIHVDFLAEYPDFFALGLVALLTVILAVGVKQSTMFNSVFTVLNLFVLTYVIICGFFNVDFKNWSIDKSEVPSGFGDGGFMPYGISGMLSGAATCFYGFVGFDCIATTGELHSNLLTTGELQLSLFLLRMSYTCVYSHYCMVGSIFPLPRVVYAMAEDRIIFGAFSKVSDKFKTPVLATLVAGLFAGVTALIFDLTELVNMMSIGTLLAYTFVAKCVVILRYRVKAFENEEPAMKPDNISAAGNNIEFQGKFSLKQLIKPETTFPTKISEAIVTTTSSILSLFAIALCVVLVNAEDDLTSGWAIYLIIQFIVLIIICMIIIAMQPSNTANIPFKVPLVPFLPELSAAVNIYLMLKLSPSTWIRFCVWMVIGFFIYFGYGFRKSKLAEQK
ncbi:high affinity cationic amino acid transporter 1 [Octopus bimaculoides]|nr:high affinity cationic amino acid transporter 1 [Octopus bimaculoides]|eukprot:XP_014769092.1 PREDICTED: high affinity cationic amino acid transporter 1-like [Octopus bimaculoides]